MLSFQDRGLFRQKEPSLENVLASFLYSSSQKSTVQSSSEIQVKMTGL